MKKVGNTDAEWKWNQNIWQKLTFSLIQISGERKTIKKHCKKHYNNQFLLVLLIILFKITSKEKLEFITAWSSIFLTACCLLIIMLFQLGLTVLWVHRSGLDFQSWAGSWKRKSFKSNVNFDLCLQFSDKSGSKFFYPDPESKRLNN